MSANLSENEEDAVEFIRSADEAYQSQLWKELGVTSRTGSRITKRLEEKGVVEREQATHDGNNTYKLILADEYTDDEGGDEGDDEQDPTAGYELDEDEQRAMRLVESEGGFPQSELWKELDVSSREGSRIASRLEDRGLVEREEVVHEGNRTYMIEPVVDKLDYSLLVAGNMISPFIGEENPDPLSGSFTEWVYELAHSEG